LDHSNLPPGNIVSISLVGTLASVDVSVTYVLTGGAANSFNGTLVIKWGDDRFSAETRAFSPSNASPSNAVQVFVDHTYVALGAYTISLSIKQSNGVLIKATFPLVQSTSDAPGSVPASGVPGVSPVGFGGGFGGFDANGQVPWKSLTNHGTPDTPGSPAGTVAFPYATQALEGFTSLPSGRGFILLISLQYSVGTAQAGNTPGQALYSSGSSQPEAAADAVVPVATRVGQANISGASGSDDGAATPSLVRLAASYGSGREIDPPPSGSERAESSVLPAALQTVQTSLDEPGPVLVGEPLRGAVPSEQDLLSIAWDIVAADAHQRREGAPSWAWLEKALIGTALGAVAAESVLWGLDLSRRRIVVRRPQLT
ncbi:MAG TPA: hypothetical protein VG099_18875, partial [Gemmataceae bacterium]|nr:hypothetical protein [Gemmataceae bacterium]